MEVSRVAVTKMNPSNRPMAGGPVLGVRVLVLAHVGRQRPVEVR
jgi:hypothetical protein